MARKPAVKKTINPAYPNSALILVIAFELGFILLAQKSFVSRVMAIVTVVGTVGFLVRPILPEILDILSPDLKEKQKALIQSARLTPWLIAAAILGLLPAVLYARWTLSPPPLLRVLPARGVFNAVSPTVRDPGVQYVLKVVQDGETVGEGEVAGAGSIYIGQNPKKQLAWIDETPADAQRKELAKYLDVEPVLDKWMDTGSAKLVMASLRRGCARIELWYVPGEGQKEEVGFETVFVKSKIEQVFLEKEDDDPDCQP